MSTSSSFSSVEISCDKALQMANTRLSKAGLWALQTFDLHTARLAMHDCPCPNHGTEACDCQMVVLLVYGKPAEPATLILHGNDGCTWFSVAEAVDQKADKTLVMDIRRALDFDASASSE